MNTSDKIAILALLVSVIGIPVSAVLSYQSAIRATAHQANEARNKDIFEAKNRLETGISMFSRIFVTEARDLGFDVTSDDGYKKLTEAQSELSKLFQRISDLGIVERLHSIMDSLRSMGFHDVIDQYGESYRLYLSVITALDDVSNSSEDRIIVLMNALLGRHELTELVSGLTIEKIAAARKR